MKRMNIYLTEKQAERLARRSEQEGIPMAELVRRALDTFLAWDDPTYAPNPSRLHKEWRSHPPHE